MLKFRPDPHAFFVNDVMAVKKFIKQEQGLEWDEKHEIGLLEQLESQVLGLSAQPETSQIQKAGYTFVNERPGR